MPCSKSGHQIGGHKPKVIADLLDADVEPAGLRSRSLLWLEVLDQIAAFGEVKAIGALPANQRVAPSSTIEVVVAAAAASVPCPRPPARESSFFLHAGRHVLCLPRAVVAAASAKCRVLDHLLGNHFFFPAGSHVLCLLAAVVAAPSAGVMSGFSDECVLSGLPTSLS